MPSAEFVWRWIHYVSGITWIGLLYFFNLVNVNFMKKLDAATKGKVVPELMPSSLWYFRWGAVVTVLSGLVLYGMNWGFNGTSSGRWWAITLGGLLGLIMFFNVWVFIWPNQKKIIAWTREAAEKGTAAPPEMAKCARVAYLASRTNFVLSFFMLLGMTAASHWK